MERRDYFNGLEPPPFTLMLFPNALSVNISEVCNYLYLFTVVSYLLNVILDSSGIVKLDFTTAWPNLVRQLDHIKPQIISQSRAGLCLNIYWTANGDRIFFLHETVKMIQNRNFCRQLTRSWDAAQFNPRVWVIHSCVKRLRIPPSALPVSHWSDKQIAPPPTHPIGWASLSALCRPKTLKQ